MKTTKSRKAKPQAQNLTIWPAYTRAQAQKIFAESVGDAADDGKNNYLEKFLAVADGVLSNGRSFCLQDVQYAARPFDIPADEVAKLFELWTSKLCSLSKLEKIEGCYSQPIFIVCN